MKVQNKTFYMGDDVHNARQNEKGKANNHQRKTIDATSLRKNLDPIAAKREEAKKKAMKIVGGAFTNEQKLDGDLIARREKIKFLQHDIGEANKSINEIEANRAALRDKYGVASDSQEEQDLKLLEKEVRAKMPGSDTTLSYDEMKKIDAIKSKGLSEYQQQSIDMLEHETPYVTTVYEANREIKVENQIISSTKIERLKSHAMEDAQKQAEDIMNEASKEIAGMLVDEAKDNIDEKAEEEKEKAEASKEKREEVKERIDALKEKKEENEELTEDILNGIADAESVSTDVNAAQQEIKNMMNKMKLIEEDIKGAAVDKNV